MVTIQKKGYWRVRYNGYYYYCNVENDRYVVYDSHRNKSNYYSDTYKEVISRVDEYLNKPWIEEAAALEEK